jgi:DNA-binding NtrC family response regulator
VGDGFQDLETSALPAVSGNTRLSMRGSDDYKRAVEEFDRSLIKKTLEENKQNVSRTASELGLSRYGLIKKIRRYGIKVAD